MNKQLKIFLSILILLIITFILLFTFMKNNDNNYKLSDNILMKIENKEDLLIYITDNKKKCLSCIDIDNTIKLYSSIYGLKFTIFDKSTTSDEDFQNLIKDYDFPKGYLTSPAVIIIKDGQLKSVVNDIISEDFLREYLVKYEFLSNKDILDTYIEDEEFNKLYRSNNKSLILVYNGGNAGYSYREKIFNLAKKYNFTYATIRYGFGNTIESISIIQDKLKDKYNLPMLIVVRNNKIVGYTTSNNTKKIKEFLNKNGFIK